MALIEQGPLIIIIIVVILLFGATAIPKLAKAMGRAKGEFTKAKGEFDREAARTIAEGSAPAASDDQVRDTARSLGIDPAGKSTAELRLLIQQKLA